MGYGINPGTQATHASDSVGGEHVSRFKLTWGAANAATLVDTGTPLPVREPAKTGSLGQNAAGITPAADTLIAAQNTNRTSIDISNGTAAGIWLTFGGGAAAAGKGSYLPSKSTGTWQTTAAVRCAIETGGTGSAAVGYTEW